MILVKLQTHVDNENNAMRAMKRGEEKIKLPFGRSVPKMDSNMINTMMAIANRADVSNRSATFIVLYYAGAVL